MSDRFFEYFIRWRHTRGYGVHSPLAYGIVRECIRPDSLYAYYADTEIDAIFCDDRRKRRKARMLLRLANQLKTSSLSTIGLDHDIGKAVMKACDIDIKDAATWGKRESDVLVTFGDISPEFGSDIPSLTLKGRDYSIYVWREGMQSVIYLI